MPALEKALPREQARLQAARDRALSAYRDYVLFLKKDSLPRSRGRFAAGLKKKKFKIQNSKVESPIFASCILTFAFS